METILVQNELNYTKKELKNIKKQTRAECDQRQNGANGQISEKKDKKEDSKKEIWEAELEKAIKKN